MIFSDRPSSGKRARAPQWWGRLLAHIPQAKLPLITPKTWTPELAQKWVSSIPAKCPFERQLWLGDRLVLYIPPLCPLNPFSAQLYSIRIEAQQFLALAHSPK